MPVECLGTVLQTLYVAPVLLYCSLGHPPMLLIECVCHRVCRRGRAFVAWPWSLQIAGSNRSCGSLAVDRSAEWGGARCGHGVARVAVFLMANAHESVSPLRVTVDA